MAINFRFSFFIFVLFCSLSHAQTNHSNSVGHSEVASTYINYADGETPQSVSAAFQSTLPIIRISTNNVDIPDEPSIEGTMEIVWNGEGNENDSEGPANEFSGNITIELRGQSSQFLYPKKGYAVETKDENGDDLDVSFLGFPEEEDWVLHGPYADKALMRNVLSMHLARKFDQYASRTRFVELLINDEYVGIYVMMEKIKRGKDRVDIAKLKDDDIVGDELTGGYIFKIDKGDYDWESDFDMIRLPGNKLKFTHVYPKSSKIEPEQAEYIQSYVDSFEYALSSSDLHFGGKRYNEYIDLTSFAEYVILQELSRNVDAYSYSSYYHKEKDNKGGKIYAGPIWDFNFAWGNANYCDGDSPSGIVYEHSGCGQAPFWFDVMFEDEVFTTVLKCSWEDAQADFLNEEYIHAFIDGQAMLLETALDRNFDKWDVLGKNIWPSPVITPTYQGEVDYLKSYISDRIAWLDENLYGECEASSIEIVNGKFKLQASPNPISNHTQISFELENSADVTLRIFDISGHLISTLVNTRHGAGTRSIAWSPGTIPSGIYLVKLTIDGRGETLRLVVSK